MAYVDIATLQTIAPGQPFQAATLQQIRDNEEFLIDPPLCSVRGSSDQSVPNSGVTAMLADNELFDNDSMHSTSVNPERITVQTPGRYRFSARVEFASASGGAREIRFYKNGASMGAAFLMTPNAGVHVVTTYVEDVSMAGDYYHVGVVQTSGADLAVTLRNFSAMYLSR